MEPPQAAARAERDQDQSPAGVRLIILNLPEDEGEGLGFRLTRTLWDPYPWVREVVPGSRADSAGLRTADCLLQADGRDLLGLPIGQVAGLIRGDGCGRGVSLLCWNCGVDPDDDPELLWSCGGAARGERSRRALSGVVRALACCVCAATAPAPARALSCARSHLYCESCWSRLDKCALCRENLPPKDSPYARNLIAEQVFEAIATEYDIRDAKRRPRAASAHNSPARSPTRSPHASPATARKGQYQLSMMTKRRVTQYTEKYASDPNIQRSLNRELNRSRDNSCSAQCACRRDEDGDTTNVPGNIPTINVEQADEEQSDADALPTCPGSLLQRRLVARLRQACSLADLHSCQRSHSPSTGRLDGACGSKNHSTSMDNITSCVGSACERPVFVVSSPPIYVVTCDHYKS